MVGEGYTQAVRADGPVQRIRNGLKVGEERHATFKGGEFSLGDGAEARVFQGAVGGY